MEKRWATQTETGDSYGVSAVAVGKALQACGLRAGREPTAMAIDQDLCLQIAKRKDRRAFREFDRLKAAMRGEAA